MAVVEDTGEFRCLREQADVLGVPMSSVERLGLDLDDGRSLSALRFGADEPAVTLLHGAGLNAHTWDAVALLLGRSVLAVDLPGHGDSAWREDADYSPETLAVDVASALETWTSQPQLLVGHSLGGLTAAIVAARHPHLVESLVLVDITPGVDPAAAPAVLREFYAVTDFAARADAVERAVAFGLGGDRAATERGVFLNTRVRADGRVEWKHHLAHLLGHSFDAVRARTEHGDEAGIAAWSALESLTVPVTLMRAARGFLQDADVDEFTRRLPTASVIAVDAGHNIQETAPAAISTLLTDALARPIR
ncbi:alpha/beta fold hydrolase [Microbacterium sp.]